MRLVASLPRRRPSLRKAVSMVDWKVAQGKAPWMICPSRLPLLRVGPMMNVGVALMLCSDASERLALIAAKVDSRSMQAFSAVMFSFSSAAMARMPLQLRQFC